MPSPKRQISCLLVLYVLSVKARRRLCRDDNSELQFLLVFLKSLLHSGCVCFDAVHVFAEQLDSPELCAAL